MLSGQGVQGPLKKVMTAFTQFRDQFLKFNKIFFRDQKKKRGFDY
jgi:hypothetical protein